MTDEFKEKVLKALEEDEFRRKMENKLHKSEDNTESSKKQGMNRRSFLKKAGLGAAGLGAAAMLSGAAGLGIQSGDGLQFNENFSVDSEGNLDLENRDISGAASVDMEKYYTVPEGSIQDIADAIENNSYVKLEPGATYTADSEVRIEKDDLANDVYVDARGAKLESTSSDAILHLWKTAACSGGEARTVTWRGGSFVGAGTDSTQSAVRLTDCFRHDILIGEAGKVERGIYWMNDECWSEANRVGYMLGGSGTDAPASKRFAVYMEGASTSGGSGTESFRCGEVHIPWGAGGVSNGNNNAQLYVKSGSLHGGRVFVKGFTPKHGGYNLWCGENGKMGSVNAYIEGEQGTEESRVIKHDGGPAPLYINPRIKGKGKNVEINIAGGATSIGGKGLRKLDKGSVITHNWSFDGATESSFQIRTNSLSEGEAGSYFTGVDKLNEPDGQTTTYVGFGKDTKERATLRSHLSGKKTRSYNVEDGTTIEHMFRGAHYDTKRGDPSNSELPEEESMTYISDGSDTGEEGDLVRAYNDGGSIKTQIIAAVSDTS